MKKIIIFIILIIVLIANNNFSQDNSNNSIFYENHISLDNTIDNKTNEVLRLQESFINCFETKNNNTSVKIDRLVSTTTPVYIDSSKMIFDYNQIGKIKSYTRQNLSGNSWNL